MPKITIEVSSEAAARIKSAFDSRLEGEREATAEDVEKWLKNRLRSYVFKLEQQRAMKELDKQNPEF